MATMFPGGVPRPKAIRGRARPTRPAPPLDLEPPVRGDPRPRPVVGRDWRDRQLQPLPLLQGIRERILKTRVW